MTDLSQAQARRVALAAQGFLDPPHAVPTMRTLSRTVARTGVLQVDSVNVLVRAHHMPLFSRMGGYDVDLLRRAAERRPRRLVEYWAHVQALMPVELWPLMQHRMDHYRGERGKWGFVASDPRLEASVRAVVADRGASTAREVEAELGRPDRRTREHWGWNWSESRKVLDYLFLAGELAIAGRTSQFEPRYDLPERVLPPDVLATPAPTPEDARRELVRRAAVSHGVGTARCLRDYYRMPEQHVRPAIDDLVESGELLAVSVQGWRRPAYLHRDARLPRRVAAAALLSPFDPVVWERERTERLFGFRYRIEIYVPAAQRVHGYYVLPFLLGDRLVARVDLKADRAADGGVGRLLVRAAYAEPGAPPETGEALLDQLRRLAAWQGLGSVRVEPRGDLAARLVG